MFFVPLTDTTMWRILNLKGTPLCEPNSKSSLNKDEETGPDLFEYYCDSHGCMNKFPTQTFPYDPRTRPWYKAAVLADKSTWTDPYAWVHKQGYRWRPFYDHASDGG